MRTVRKARLTGTGPPPKSACRPTWSGGAMAILPSVKFATRRFDHVTFIRPGYAECRRPKTEGQMTLSTRRDEIRSAPMSARGGRPGRDCSVGELLLLTQGMVRPCVTRGFVELL